MGILEFFGFGRRPSKRDWIQLSSPELSFEQDLGEARVWSFHETGDLVGVYFFDLPPDLPRTADVESFIADRRDFSAESGVELVELSLSRISGLPAVRQIVKAPQSPSGMAYLGSFTIPFRDFSYVVKLQCQEHGMTGLREAVLLAEGLENKSVTLHSDSELSGPIQGDWNPDSEVFDERFPDHPLSRLRRQLRVLEGSVQLNEAVFAFPLFNLPEDSD